MDELEIDVNVYYASEIDEDAVAVSSIRYPNICNIGDIRNLSDSEVGIVYMSVALCLTFGCSSSFGTSHNTKGIKIF